MSNDYSLKLISLKKRQHGDLIEAYESLTGKERVDQNCFFILDKKHGRPQARAMGTCPLPSPEMLKNALFAANVV